MQMNRRVPCYIHVPCYFTPTLPVEYLQHPSLVPLLRRRSCRDEMGVVECGAGTGAMESAGGEGAVSLDLPQAADENPDQAGIRRRRESRQHLSLLRKRKRCEVCEEDESKYCCPRCAVLSCSVQCVKRHKKEHNCTGERVRSSYLPRGQLDEAALISGMARVLRLGTEEQGGSVDAL